MKLLFAYIGSFRNYKHLSVNFVDGYECFYDGHLRITRTEKNPVREELFGNSPLKDLTIVVGETGSGKTNLFQLIGMDHFHRSDLLDDSSYLLLWLDDTSGKYITEICNLHPENLKVELKPYQKDENFIKLLEFETNKDGYPINPAEIDRYRKWDTYIVNCFDLGAFSVPPCFDQHDDGLNDNEYFPRLVVPFKRVNVGIACEHLHHYLITLPQDNIKRQATLRINAFNWSDDFPMEIDEKLKNRHYWTYRDKKVEQNNQIRKNRKQQSPKYQFLHDLLADYALYLRKWAQNAIDPQVMKDENAVKKGWLPPSPSKVTPDFSSAGASIPDLLERIEWLGSFIDSHFDDYFGEMGLVWQITTDIRDIYEILNSFDDKYFSEECFSLPIVDMDFTEKRLSDLFERMTAYRDDEFGIFTKELLPYQIDGISSGEYQYAKTLGAVDEFCIRLKVSHERSGKKYIRPNFILLLDEPDAYMHPELCRKFIRLMGDILSKDSGNSQIQIFMSTHSPFMLSDVVSDQVIRLKADENGYGRILPKSEKSTFAAGIHSIMANDFFLKYTIGENTRGILVKLMSDLKQVAAHEKDHEESSDILRRASMIIPIIGDDVMRHYFNMLLEAAQQEI